MPPLRRYLRITKYSVLELRIYLDNPHLATSWLLNPRHPILPLVISAIRPLVLPKLREENERRRKGGKKKGVKDVVVEGEFEVAIFLTETSTRHYLLAKQKHLRDVTKAGLTSNSHKLTGATREHAVEIEEGEGSAAVVVREESEDDEDVALSNVPAAESAEVEGEENAGDMFVQRGSKRPRGEVTSSAARKIIIPSSDEDSDGDGAPQAKRAKAAALEADDDDDDDDEKKKKMRMDTTYDGFSIYGRVLCLIVKKRDAKGKGRGGAASGGQAMMEDWIASTQMALDE